MSSNEKNFEERNDSRPDGPSDPKVAKDHPSNHYVGCDSPRYPVSHHVQKLECENERLRKRLCELECRYVDLRSENELLKKMVRESC